MTIIDLLQWNWNVLYSGTARRKERQQTNRAYCHRATSRRYRNLPMTVRSSPRLKCQFTTSLRAINSCRTRWSRDATTREKRCLDHQELSPAFPILNDPSLKGCKLDKESRHEDTVSYPLVCEGGHGTTGTAIWYLGADQIRGTLDVRLGGKNMTFYQRITAQPMGKCGSEGN